MKIYDFLSPGYDEVKNMLEKVLTEELSQKKMLDLASGEGKHLAFFFEKKVKNISVADHNIEGLKKIYEKYKGCGSNIELIYTDIMSTKFDNTFDLVYLGDNSIQLFDTYSNQYKIIEVIASALKRDGVAIINFTPLVEENILKFNNGFTKMNNEGEEMMEGKLMVDIFNQELVYYFRNTEETRTIRTRILLKKELEDMVDSVGLTVSKINAQKCKNGNITFFYILKYKDI